MSTPARRPSSRPSRRQREARAYRLTLATGGAALATVVTAILALITSFSWGVVILLAVITVALGMMLRSTVS